MSISTQSISAVTVAGSTTAGKTEVKRKEEDGNWFSDWLTNKDKVCTDGEDDGSISFSEGLQSFGKGLMGIVKTAINHPIATAATVAAGAAATILTGGAALPIMVAAGAAVGAGTIGYGAYNAATAKTDAEAKQAWETIGNGTFAVAASVAGAKPALNAAAKAGVTSARGAENMSALQATVQSFKATPEALKMSALNSKGNILTWTTGTVHAHSNALQGADTYVSKPNDVQAYRFNPNGTPDEILANNPGVEQVNGKYGVVDKWTTEALQKAMQSGQTEQQAIKSLNLDASKVSGGKVYHTIDPSKNPMIMMYGGDDMAVCDGAVFKGSYVDQAAFKADGTKTYVDPAKVEYGKVIDVTKQAPGAFKVMPSGTKVQTVSEGVQTVTDGQVVAIDHAGNPYVTTPKNILKRNTNITESGLQNLAQVDYETVALTQWKNEFKSDLSFLPDELRPQAAKLIDQNSRYTKINDDIQLNVNGKIETKHSGIASYEPQIQTNPDGRSALLDNPKLALKLDLLQSKGIQIEVKGSDYRTPVIETISVTENGATKTFNLNDGLKWIDSKLGITD